MEEGFIALSRKFFENPLWTEPRTYTRAEAWLDLLQDAAWRERKKIVGGRLIDVPRGGIVASVRFLSDRWKWSTTKVVQYLEMLRSEGMISTEKTQGITVILLCNYDLYNPPEKTAKRQVEDSGKTAGRQTEDEIEQGKQRKEGLSPAGARADDDLDPPGYEPPLKDWISLCGRYSIPAWYAEEKHRKYAEEGWRRGTTPLLWRNCVKRVSEWYENDGRPQESTKRLNGNHRQNDKQSPRVAGTRNEGVAAQYRGIGRIAPSPGDDDNS